MAGIMQKIIKNIDRMIIGIKIIMILMIIYLILTIIQIFSMTQ